MNTPKPEVAHDGSLLCPHCYEPISLPAPTVRPSLQTAYLVAAFKLIDNMPTFVGVDIFSEPEPTVDSNLRCFVVEKVEDVTYAKAEKVLRERVQSAPRLAWVLPHLKLRGVI